RGARRLVAQTQPIRRSAPGARARGITDAQRARAKAAARASAGLRRRGRLDRRCTLDIIVKQVPNQSAALDLVFQALADPTRRDMVERLTRGPVSVSELAKPFPMTLPAVVQHLKVVEARGLVRSEKARRASTCRIWPMGRL